MQVKNFVGLLTVVDVVQDSMWGDKSFSLNVHPILVKLSTLPVPPIFLCFQNKRR